MPRIAVLISDNLLQGGPDPRDDRFEVDEQMSKLIPAFAAAGMQADVIRWREAAERAPDYDAYLPLFVWDYFQGNEDAFLAEIARASEHTQIFNPFDVLRDNADKAYLDVLAAKGAPVIDTIPMERVTQTGVARAFETLGTDILVIKPRIGGGAWRQVLYRKGDPFPAADTLPPEGALVQAFLPSVQEEGEYSFLYFDGRFSHATLKTPKDGDYRIQSIYGGSEQTYSPTLEDRNAARAVLDVLDFVPLYARIDLLRGLDGQLKLIELEMIEPYLYLTHAEGEGGDNKGAQRLAAALAKRLS